MCVCRVWKMQQVDTCGIFMETCIHEVSLWGGWTSEPGNIRLGVDSHEPPHYGATGVPERKALSHKQHNKPLGVKHTLVGRLMRTRWKATLPGIFIVFRS